MYIYIYIYTYIYIYIYIYRQNGGSPSTNQNLLKPRPNLEKSPLPPLGPLDSPPPPNFYSLPTKKQFLPHQIKILKI